MSKVTVKPLYVVYVLFLWLVTLAVLIGLDVLWLNIGAYNFYVAELTNTIGLSNLMQITDASKLAGLGVYVLMSGALVRFVFLPYMFAHFFYVQEKQAEHEVPLAVYVSSGYFLGLCVYGVFELTNFVIFPNWSLLMVMVDMAWGGLLFALATTIVWWMFSYIPMKTNPWSRTTATRKPVKAQKADKEPTQVEEKTKKSSTRTTQAAAEVVDKKATPAKKAKRTTKKTTTEKKPLAKKTTTKKTAAKKSATTKTAAKKEATKTTTKKKAAKKVVKKSTAAKNKTAAKKTSTKKAPAKKK